MGYNKTCPRCSGDGEIYITEDDEEWEKNECYEENEGLSERCKYCSHKKEYEKLMKEEEEEWHNSHEYIDFIQAMTCVVFLAMIFCALIMAITIINLR